MQPRRNLLYNRSMYYQENVVHENGIIKKQKTLVQSLEKHVTFPVEKNIKYHES